MAARPELGRTEVPQTKLGEMGAGLRSLLASVSWLLPGGWVWQASGWEGGPALSFVSLAPTNTSSVMFESAPSLWRAVSSWGHLELVLCSQGMDPLVLVRDCNLCLN